MRGPAAPKDPEKARPYFYIIKEKDIFFFCFMIRSSFADDVGQAADKKHLPQLRMSVS